MRTGAWGGQRHQIPLDLDLHRVVSHLIWVLETELGSSPRATMLSTARPSLHPEAGLNFNQKLFTVKYFGFFSHIFS